jgi:hypothetical protein
VGRTITWVPSHVRAARRKILFVLQVHNTPSHEGRPYTLGPTLCEGVLCPSCAPEVQITSPVREIVYNEYFCSFGVWFLHNTTTTITQHPFTWGGSYTLNSTPYERVLCNYCGGFVKSLFFIFVTSPLIEYCLSRKSIVDRLVHGTKRNKSRWSEICLVPRQSQSSSMRQQQY